jgi:hypothetical protein
MLSGPGWMMSDLERAVQRAESAKRLNSLGTSKVGKTEVVPKTMSVPSRRG